MKLLIAALLPALVSAFVPTAKINVAARSAVSTTELTVATGPNGKPASSKEEDLELTLQIILESLATQDDGDAIVDDDDDSAAAVPEKPTAKKKKKQKKSPPQDAAPEEMDVSKLDIRVGVIQEAWEHDEADKLFCEKIDIGEEEPRSIASGLRAYYKVEDLVGKRVVVLANLKARKLVGFPSHGMVLCASNDDSVVFVDPPADAAIGERVLCAGYEGEPATENQVGKKKILDKVFPDLKTDSNGVASYKGIPLTAGSGSCVAEASLANAQVSYNWATRMVTKSGIMEQIPWITAFRWIYNLPSQTDIGIDLRNQQSYTGTMFPNVSINTPICCCAKRFPYRLIGTIDMLIGMCHYYEGLHNNNVLHLTL